MTSQVITIDREGTMSGLQVKRGRGLDLKSMGHAKVERASEITWDETAQCWRVHVLNEVACQWMMNHTGGRDRPYLKGGVTLTSNQRFMATGDAELPKGATYSKYGDGDWLGFPDYDDAVAAEIEFLNALRIQGKF